MAQDDDLGAQTPECTTPGTLSTEETNESKFFTSEVIQPSDESGILQRQEVSLPPLDGGKHAWLFLAAVFLVEGLVWGFPFAFGVFEDYYDSHEPFQGQPNTAVIGTTTMGVMYMTSPIIMGLCRTFRRWTRWAPLVGLLIMSLSLAVNSFATTSTHLIIFHGILYGLGGGIAYCPCIVYLDEWFVKRKGLAYGVMWSGTGLAGVVLPLLLRVLLDRLGFRNTMRIWAGLLLALTAPLAYFIKPRLPLSEPNQARPVNLYFLATPAFLLYQLANIIESVGFFLPGIYLPKYARSTLGTSSLLAALTVLLLNVASMFGCIAMGWFIDRLHVTTCILLSTVGAAVSVLVIWGLSSSLWALYLFCVVYGLFAGSFTSAWTGIMRDMAQKGQDDDKRHVDPTMVFGFLCAGRGVGNVVGGPLSQRLMRGSAWKNEAAYAYGSGYGGLIVFIGVTSLLGGSCFIWRRLGLL